ncbi:hypothetical protein ACHAXM_007490 [Skeletonema potamos]
MVVMKLEERMHQHFQFRRRTVVCQKIYQCTSQNNLFNKKLQILCSPLIDYCYNNNVLLSQQGQGLNKKYDMWQSALGKEKNSSRYLSLSYQTTHFRLTVTVSMHMVVLYRCHNDSFGIRLLG